MELLISQFVSWVSGLIANLITQITKTDKQKLPLTPEQEVAREKKLQMFNAAISLITVIGMSWLTGDVADMNVIEGAVGTLVAGVSAFLYSQANYHLFKRAKINQAKKTGASPDPNVAQPVVRTDLPIG